MLKTKIGTGPDGFDRFDYELTQDEHDRGLVAFLTGPVTAGTVTLPDGTSYNITDFVIAVRREDVGELHLAIHRAHHAAGRFLDVPLPDLADVSLPDAPVKKKPARVRKRD